MESERPDRLSRVCYAQMSTRDKVSGPIFLDIYIEACDINS